MVVLWTGPWSPLPKVSAGSLQVKAISSISHKATSVAFPFAPFIGGTAILASWLVMLLFIRPGATILGQVFRDTFRQMWGALLVGFFIFGLAFVFNYSGMGASLAFGFSNEGDKNLVKLAEETGGRVEYPLQNVYKDVSGYLSQPRDEGNYAIQPGTGGYAAAISSARLACSMPAAASRIC